MAERSAKALTQSKIQVGKTATKLNYAPGENVFPKDLVPEARKAKLEVISRRDKNILGRKQNPWNISVAKPNHEPKRSRELSQHDHPQYQINFRGEVLPPKLPPYIPKRNKYQLNAKAYSSGRETKMSDTSKRVEEMPVNPSLDGKPMWNNSTEIDLKERSAKIQHDEEGRSNNSSKRRHLPTKYETPQAQVLKNNQVMRSKKMALAGKERLRTSTAPLPAPVNLDNYEELLSLANQVTIVEEEEVGVEGTPTMRPFNPETANSKSIRPKKSAALLENKFGHRMNKTWNNFEGI